MAKIEAHNPDTRMIHVIWDNAALLVYVLLFCGCRCDFVNE
jgi:hypothetical protein